MSYYVIFFFIMICIIIDTIIIRRDLFIKMNHQAREILLFLILFIPSLFLVIKTANSYYLFRNQSYIIQFLIGLILLLLIDGIVILVIKKWLRAS